MALDGGEADLIVERIGVDPGTAFGDAPVDPVSYRGTEYFGSDGDDNIGGGDGPGDTGGNSGDDGREPGDYYRYPDGSIKRNKDGSPRRKRRRRGSVNGTSRNTQKTEGSTVLDAKQVANVLMAIMNSGAGALKVPELEMDQDEADGIGQAVSNVSRHYDIPVTGKQIDLMVLAYTVTMAVGPRVVLYGERMKREKAERARATQATTPQAPAVTPRHGPSNQNMGAATATPPSNGAAGFPEFKY